MDTQIAFSLAKNKVPPILYYYKEAETYFLNFSIVVHSVASLGKLFQIDIMLGKNECW